MSSAILGGVTEHALQRYRERFDAGASDADVVAHLVNAALSATRLRWVGDGVRERVGKDLNGNLVGVRLRGDYVVTVVVPTDSLTGKELR